MAQQNAPRAKKQIHKAVSKKRKFVKDGVFYAELNDFLANELSEQGYAGCEVRVTPQRTEIIIRATNTGDVIGDNGRRIRELTALIQKRFKFPRNGLICFAERVRNKGFSALTQAQAVKYRLLTGLTVRRAAYSCLKYIMDDSDRKNGAMGCEIIVSGKLRGQRAKGMKFRDGFMIHAGDAANYYIDTAVKHVHLPQGVIGIKVKIMKPYDSTGRDGVTMELPDKIQVLEPKEENESGRIGGGQDMAEHLRGITRPQGGGGGGGGGGPSGGQGGPPPPQPPTAPQGPPRPRPPMAPQNNQGGGGGGGYGGDVNDQFGGGGGAMDQGQAQQDTQQQQMGGGDISGAPQFDVNQGQAPQQQQYGTQPAQGQEYGQQFDQYGGQQGGQSGGGGQYGQQQQQQGQQHYDQYGNPVSAQQQQYGGGQPQYGGQTGQQGGQGQYNNQGGGYYEQNRGGNYQNY